MWAEFSIKSIIRAFITANETDGKMNFKCVLLIHICSTSFLTNKSNPSPGVVLVF